MAGRILKGVDFQPTLDKFNSLGEFFFENGEKYGNNICQIDADLDKSETYSSVRKRSIRLAINLQKKGVTSKDVIAICSYNTIDNTIPVIATTYLGAKIVNLDPTLSIRQTQHLIDVVNPRIIFVQSDSLSLIENTLSRTDSKPEIILFEKSTKYQSFEDMVLPCPNEDQFKPTKVDKNEIGVMFFSSGSTGLPKAICHSHYSFLMVTEVFISSNFDLRVVLHFTTFYWVSGIRMLTCSFMNGHTRVFGRALEGESTLKMIEKYKITALFIAPIYTYKLTSVKNPERFHLPSFKCLLTGGTPLGTKQLTKLSSLFPHAQILFTYGMTEIGIGSFFHPNDDDFIKNKLGSTGTAAPLSKIKVVDPDTEEILGPNQKGEIRIKTPTVMKGYYEMDSSSSFDSDGYIKSGDLGYYDEDDCIYIDGRMKEMFKYLSWRIVPSLIEAVLFEHPATEEAVVFGIPRGAEGEVPAACVVLKDGFDVDKGDIEKFVAERVSDREKLRGGIVFLKDIPKTPTGKVIRNEARNIAIKSM